MEDKRIEWIDNMRGLAVLFVMFGHTVVPEIIRYWIYNFHMPLFFFCSGFLFYQSAEIKFINFLKKLWRNLLIPAITFSVMYIIVKLFLFEYLVMGRSSINEILKSFKAILTQNIYWFFVCLFLVQLLYYAICRVVHSSLKRFMLSVTLMLCGFIYQYYINYEIIWKFNVSMVAIGFFALGDIVRYYYGNKLKIVLANKKIYRGMLIVNVFINYIAYYILEIKSVDMYRGLYGNYMFFIITSITAIFGIMGLFIHYEKNNFIFLNFCGKNSSVFYCVPPMISMVPSIIVYHFCHFNNETASWYMLILVGAFYVIVESIFSIVCVFFMRKYFPFLLGSQKEKGKRPAGVVYH